jgi:hypothetical protein
MRKLSPLLQLGVTTHKKWIFLSPLTPILWVSIWPGLVQSYMAEREFVAELSPALINPPAFQES